MRELIRVVSMILNVIVLAVPFLLGGAMGYALTQFPDACSRVNGVCEGTTPYLFMVGYAVVFYFSIGIVVSLIKLRSQIKRGLETGVIWLHLFASAGFALLGSIMLSIVLLRVF